MQTRLDIILETVSQILEGKEGKKKRKKKAKERKPFHPVEDRSEYDYDGPRLSARERDESDRSERDYE